MDQLTDRPTLMTRPDRLHMMPLTVSAEAMPIPQGGTVRGSEWRSQTITIITFPNEGIIT